MPDSARPLPGPAFIRPGARTGWALLLMAMPLSACVSTSPPTAQIAAAESDMPASWYQADGTGARIDEAEELSRWWARFDDPILTDLVERSIAANTDIAAALGRLRSARGAVRFAEGGLLPTLSASGNATRSDTVRPETPAVSNYDVGLDAAWEIDLFGQQRATAVAAEADFEASKARLFDVQRAVTAEVGLNYMNLRGAQARLSIAESNLEIQRENRQIASWLYQAGLTSALDVEQAETLVAQTEASLPPLRQTVANTIAQIDVLMGQPPGTSLALLETNRPLPSAPAVVNTGLPAALLERRPDIVAARRTLEAEAIRIGIARADLYPALRLSGSLSSSSPTTGGLLETIAGNLVGSITAPIFQGGQIRARIEQQRGSADAALADYRGAILTGLQDVENALTAIRTAREQEAALARAEESAALTVRLAEFRYQSGEIDFQVLLDAQRSLLSAQDSRQSAITAQSTAAVQLYKALGGGWPAPGAAIEGQGQ